MTAALYHRIHYPGHPTVAVSTEIIDASVRPASLVHDEVCGTCTDFDNEHWVPVVRCADASRNQPADGAPADHLWQRPRCSSCGSENLVESEDELGITLQCLAMDCLQMTVVGEDE